MNNGALPEPRILDADTGAEIKVNKHYLGSRGHHIVIVDLKQTKAIWDDWPEGE